MNNSPITDASFAKAFGVVCTENRNDLGLSQQAFALKVGMDPKNYQCIEYGVNSKGAMTNPQMRTILAIARGFGLTPHELLEEAWEEAHKGR
ncbi:helix-turn-helix domain-containing protein [Flaviflexus sp.]|uniref:helix-turn-helix domain-containing protein n=1 Tax=Flaviflexus sp. TaxID=1969482 RepID=UPI003F91131B